jgi:preprotein translocase subunit SecB
MENQDQPGFKILNVVLLESSFKREDNIDFSKQYVAIPNINTGFTLGDNNTLICGVELAVDAFIDNVKIFESKIKMAANFEIIGQPELETEKFGAVNAPSIIFPFLREHFASLTAKAGVNTVLLPPVNFVALHEAGQNKK